LSSEKYYFSDHTKASPSERILVVTFSALHAQILKSGINPSHSSFLRQGSNSKYKLRKEMHVVTNSEYVLANPDGLSSFKGSCWPSRVMADRSRKKPKAQSNPKE
jgi:hypothetical protein